MPQSPEAPTVTFDVREGGSRVVDEKKSQPADPVLAPVEGKEEKPSADPKNRNPR